MIILILIILVVLLLIYYFYFTKTSVEELETVRPDGDGKDVDRVLSIVQKKWMKKAEDWRVIGSLQQYNKEDKYEAYKAYTEMVKEAEPEDFHFYTEIIDRQDVPQEDKDVQMAILNSLAKPEKKVKMKWHVDRQNVHDTVLNKEITKRYRNIKKLNDFNIKISDVDKLVFEKGNSNAKMVWDKIKDNKATISSIGGKETDFVLNVFSRSRDPVNANVKKELETSFIDALSDSVENGTVVCLKGRVARLSNSLSHIDYACKDVIKTKQVLLNEMLGTASKINENMLKEVSEEELKSYNKSENPELEEKIKNKIKNDLTEIYKGKDDVSKIIDEVLLAV